MTDKQHNAAMLHLLISMEAQLITLRDFLLVYICHPVRGDRKQSFHLFNETVRERKEKLFEAIQEDTTLDIDDLLRQIFDDDGA
jgi:hypothetical protein